MASESRSKSPARSKSPSRNPSPVRSKSPARAPTNGDATPSNGTSAAAPTPTKPTAWWRRARAAVFARLPSSPDTVGRNLALFRITFYLIMAHEYHKFRFEPLALESKPFSAPVDRMYAYDHLEWVQDLWPTSRETLHRDQKIGVACALMSAAGFCFPLAAGIFALLFCRQYFGVIDAFNNHDYLFCLLLCITACSGAGQALSVDALVGKLLPAVRHDFGASFPRRRCFLVMLRLQCAVIYCFAAGWKLHIDWLKGRIVSGIFLGFEKDAVNRGVPWTYLVSVWPKWLPLGLWPCIALGGLTLDFGMFVSLTFAKPTWKTMPLVVAMHLQFHLFTMYTMSQRIGYSFPATCIIAEFLFLPLADAADGGEDAATLVWLRRLAVGDQVRARAPRVLRALVVGWALFHYIFPLRMFAFSQHALFNGDWPRTSETYRFGWTMMMHSTNAFAANERAAIPLFGLHPSCVADEAKSGPRASAGGALTAAGDDGAPIQISRGDYASPVTAPDGRQVKQWEGNVDPLTLPVEQVLGLRRQVFMMMYYRQWPRLAGGFKEILEGSFRVCERKGRKHDRVAIHATLFTQLNDFGPFVRTMDPTVDLTLVWAALANRTRWETLVGSLVDKPPEGHEYFLRGIQASMNRAEAERLEVELEHSGRPVVTIIDRSPCMAARPLLLRGGGAVQMMVRVLRAPSPLNVEACMAPQHLEGEPDCRTIPLPPDAAEVLLPPVVRITVWPSEPAKGTCADAEEDILLALNY